MCDGGKGGAKVDGGIKRMMVSVCILYPMDVVLVAGTVVPVRTSEARRRRNEALSSRPCQRASTSIRVLLSLPTAVSWCLLCVLLV